MSTIGQVATVNPRITDVGPDSPFVTMADVAEWGRWATSKSSRGTRGGVRAAGGDVLVARITPCLENGKIAQVPHDWPSVGGSTEFIVVRAGNELLADFVYLWAQSPDTHRRAVSKMIGSTGRQRIGAADFMALPIGVPPLDEQRRIVDLIGALDCVIALHAVLNGRAAGGHLHQLRSNLLTALLSGEYEIPASYDDLTEELAA